MSFPDSWKSSDGLAYSREISGGLVQIDDDDWYL